MFPLSRTSYSSRFLSRLPRSTKFPVLLSQNQSTRLLAAQFSASRKFVPKNPEDFETPKKKTGPNVFLGIGILGSVLLAAYYYKIYRTEDDKKETNSDQTTASDANEEIMDSERFTKEEIAAFPFNSKKIVFVLGGPGSGKGTNSLKLVEEFGFVHLSAGDLLRAEQNRPGSKVGQAIKGYISAGTIVPYSITIALLRDAIMDHPDATKFLIDGFPRSLDQARAFEKTITDCQAVLFYDCPVSTMFDRIMDRSKTSGRIDDNEETLRNRFKVYLNQSYPVIQDYSTKDKVRAVSCIGSVDDVYNKTKLSISDIVN
ncbi:hypothetical protein BB560_002658 [Smittium megazygosporum]|uniref:Uncharacterized protein n=1 Tax=Smittium megazygosporum TaxID=133381 RepID=A0A2T9ZE76_9FUNG|nr:hypothetical protein BB560_002659 [Smittium megazygosporum]PVV02876.1 hypothetical protein BB560_002658 [Smittium megazygosporum]